MWGIPNGANYLLWTHLQHSKISGSMSGYRVAVNVHNKTVLNAFHYVILYIPATSKPFIRVKVRSYWVGWKKLLFLTFVVVLGCFIVKLCSVLQHLLCYPSCAPLTAMTPQWPDGCIGHCVFYSVTHLAAARFLFFVSTVLVAWSYGEWALLSQIS